MIFSHSFLIGGDGERNEPIKMLTGNIAGSYGVLVFFIMSGFLITGSRMNTRTTRAYAWKRFLRIYPAYATSLLISFLIISPFFVAGGLSSVFKTIENWYLLLLSLLFDFESAYVLHLQFYDGRGANGILNGVLWTIQAEVLLYFCIGILFSFRLLRFPACLLLLVIAIYARSGNHYLGFMVSDTKYLNLWPITIGAPGFFAGATLWFVFQKYRPNGWIAAVLAATAIAGALIADRTLVLFTIAAAYPVLWLGTSAAPNLGNWTRFGDLSYGVYVFGWPVQQLVRAATGPLDGWIFFSVCLVPVLLAGWLSWRFVERPSLTLKSQTLKSKRPINV